MTSTSNLRKAAILVSRLPEVDAQQLVRRLDMQQARQLSHHLAGLGRVQPDEQQAVVDELTGACGVAARESSPADRALHVRPEADSPASRPPRTAGERPLARLRRLPPPSLQQLLGGEHPQLVALVAAHLPAHLAAAVLAGLPADRQADVIRRMSVLGPVGVQVLRDLDHALAVQLLPSGPALGSNPGGPAGAARLLAAADPQTRQRILDQLADGDPHLVAQLHSAGTPFEHLAALSDREFRVLLRHVDRGVWAAALKDGPAELLRKVLANLPPRAGELLHEHGTLLGALRPEAVRAARQQVVEMLQRLRAAGLLSPAAA